MRIHTRFITFVSLALPILFASSICFAAEMLNVTPENSVYDRMTPFWLRTWFLLPMALFIGLVIYLTVRLVCRYRSFKGMNELLEDLVERRTRALRHSEEQYRYLVENSVDGIFIIQNSMFQFMNKRVPEILGWTENELEKKGLVAVITPQQQVGAQIALDRVISNSKIQLREEYKVVTKQNKEVDIELTGSRIEYRGRPAFHGLVRDITEHRRLEGQLLAVKRMEMVGSLAGGIAHDFNNLLTTIMGHVSLVLAKIHQGDQNYEQLTAAQEAAFRATELTRQLQSFSQKGKYNPQLLNLNDILEETLKLIRRTFPVKIEIRVYQELDIYPILADPMYLQQLIIELCVNARDAIEQKGLLTISTMNVEIDEDYCRLHREIKPGKYSKLTVSDTGIGMTPEIKKRMFEPFFTTKALRSGMGLAMVYGIVKNHGGHFNVESMPGKGTSIDNFFPAVEAIIESPKVSISNETDGGIILVADDDKMIVDVTKAILEELGYQVFTANSSKETLEMFRKNPQIYDLALLDIEMPLQTGTQMYLAMKKIRPDIKVVFCSGATVDSATKDMWDKGVCGFIEKPFKKDTLAEVIRVALSK